MKTIKFINSGEKLNVGKIVCLGRNYADHAKEMHSEVPSTPIIFLKPPSALIFNRDYIIRPKISNLMHHEVEVVVVIGKTAKDVLSANADEYIAGYGIGLDMTLRDIQNDSKSKGLPWTVCKGFDTSAAISDIVPKSAISNPSGLQFQCKVNGVIRQQGNTRNMIFSYGKMIEYISSLITLEPGDLIYTGTPEGVGEVNDGDEIEAELIGYTKISHRIRTA
jgi:5-carboxymethyl-2-hydroxymuconate isomerase